MEHKKNIRLINLTPHEIIVADSEGHFLETIPTEKISARVHMSQRLIGTVNGIPVYKTVFGNVENLPDPQDGVFYIVALPVQLASPDRDDLLRPDTGPTAIRKDGNVVAVVQFTV